MNQIGKINRNNGRDCVKNHGSDALLDAINERIVYAEQLGRRMTSPSGKELRWLIDLRRLMLDGEMLGLFANLFWERFGDRWPFQVGGLETASIPLISAIILKGCERGNSINAFVVRKERKTSGLANVVEGIIDQTPIIIVDDILNSGTSLEKVRMVLADLTHSISYAFAIVDFENRRAADWSRKHNIKVESLFTLNDLGLNRTGKDVSSPSSLNLASAWVFASPDPDLLEIAPKSTAAYDGNRLYVGSDKGILWAVNPDTGVPIWKYQVNGTGQKGVRSSPAVNGDRVYFGAYDGCLYCLDSINGEEIWRFSGADWIGSSPTVAPEIGLLFIGLEHALPNAKGGIAAIDLASGSLRWEFRVPGYVHGTPLVSPDRTWVACGTNDGELISFEAVSGRLRWRYQAGGAIKSAPAYDAARNLLLAGSFDQALHAVDAASGQMVWRAQTKGRIYTTPLVESDCIIVGSTDKNIYIVDAGSGAVLKRLKVDGKVYAAPVRVGNRIFLGSTSGMLIALDRNRLEISDTLQLPERITENIVFCPEREMLVVPTADNRLFGFRWSSREETVEFRADGAAAAPTESVEADGRNEQMPLVVDVSTAYAEGHYFRIPDPEPEVGTGKPFPILPSRRMFGAAAMLMMASPAHKRLSLKELEWLLMPPVALGQARMFLYGLRPIGFVTWAYLSAEAEKRVLAGERLNPPDWRSGDRFRLIDLVAPFGGGKEMAERVKQEVFGKNTTLHSLHARL